MILPVPGLAIFGVVPAQAPGQASDIPLAMALFLLVPVASVLLAFFLRLYGVGAMHTPKSQPDEPEHDPDRDEGLHEPPETSTDQSPPP